MQLACSFYFKGIDYLDFFLAFLLERNTSHHPINTALNSHQYQLHVLVELFVVAIGVVTARSAVLVVEVGACSIATHSDPFNSYHEAQRHLS